MLNRSTGKAVPSPSLILVLFFCLRFMEGLFKKAHNFFNKKFLILNEMFRFAKQESRSFQNGYTKVKS